MDVLIDTSIIIAVILNESSKNSIIEKTKGYNLIAPESLHWEVGNALSALFKKKKINLEIALEALVYYQQIQIRLLKIDLDMAINLSYNLNMYAYDAYMIAGAKLYNAPLFTLDKKLKEKAIDSNIKIWEV